MTENRADRDGGGDLEIVRKVSLTSALEGELERLIADGELAPGERLNENQLAVRFGTSRGPLREATRSLEAKGFVHAIRNRGVFVRQLTLEEALEIYDLRAALFGLAGWLLAQRLSDPIRERLDRLVADMDVAAAADDFETYYPLNIEFHETIVHASGSDVLIGEYLRFVKRLHLFRAKALVQSGALKISNAEHRTLVEALKSGDADNAREVHWQHVQDAKQRLLAASARADADEADI